MNCTCNAPGVRVHTTGPINSDILVVQSYPSWNDVRNGVPFSGDFGAMMQYEFRYGGFNLHSCRVTSFLLHPRGAKKSFNFDFNTNECMQLAFRSLYPEMSNRKAIIFLGDMMPPIFGLPDLGVIGSIVLPVLPNICMQGLFVFTDFNIGLNMPVGELRISLKHLRERLNDER